MLCILPRFCAYFLHDAKPVPQTGIPLVDFHQSFYTFHASLTGLNGTPPRGWTSPICDPITVITHTPSRVPQRFWTAAISAWCSESPSAWWGRLYRGTSPSVWQHGRSRFRRSRISSFCLRLLGGLLSVHTDTAKREFFFTITIPQWA